MASTPLFTFQDMAELLWEVFNPATKPPTGRELRIAKLATIAAYREACTIHKWTYYNRSYTFSTDAEYETGTVAYDHTGGTYERMLTLTTGTWPTNAALGTVVLDGVHYEVDERKSDSIITLPASSNPGADVSAGESYLWYRDSYQLPVNFRRALVVVEQGGHGIPLSPTDPASQFVDTHEFGSSPSSNPEEYAIRGGSNYLGGMEIVLSRPPESATSYKILYQAVPAELRTYKYSTGTVSVTAGSTAVTGGSTVFSTSHVGSVIRFTTSTTVEPTGPAGNVSGDDNPYLAQRVIMAVSGTTALTIDAAVSATTSLSGTKYVISDPIDVEPVTMRSYLEALAIYHYARLTKRGEAKEMYAEANRCMLEAMAQDSRHAEVQHAIMDGSRAGWGSVWGDVDVDPT